MYPPKPLKLADCKQHGPGAELYIVEGDSASSTVAQLRDERFQAVLPMQGKPLNAMKATLSKVGANPWFAALIDAVGADYGEHFELPNVAYEKIILLMDPDADGIHCGALLLMFFQRFMQPLLKSGRIALARAPMATIQHGKESIHVRSEQEQRAEIERLRQEGVTNFEIVRYRGLAGMNMEVLAATCIHPGTRSLAALGIADAEAATAVFGGGLSLSKN
jgi:DNA gyrase subunit B